MKKQWTYRIFVLEEDGSVTTYKVTRTDKQPLEIEKMSCEISRDAFEVIKHIKQ